MAAAAAAAPGGRSAGGWEGLPPCWKTDQVCPPTWKRWEGLADTGRLQVMVCAAVAPAEPWRQCGNVWMRVMPQRQAMSDRHCSAVQFNGSSMSTRSCRLAAIHAALASCRGASQQCSQGWRQPWRACRQPKPCRPSRLPCCCRARYPLSQTAPAGRRQRLGSQQQRGQWRGQRRCLLPALPPSPGSGPGSSAPRQRHMRLKLAAMSAGCSQMPPTSSQAAVRRSVPGVRHVRSGGGSGGSSSSSS